LFGLHFQAVRGGGPSATFELENRKVKRIKIYASKTALIKKRSIRG